MKRCGDCGETKSLDQYYRNRAKKDGLQAACKPCQRGHTKSWFERNPERVARFKMTERTKRYGVTPEWFEQQFIKQGGRCAICRSPKPRGKNWQIDHDHRCCPGQAQSCGACLRSILCGNCNLGLGAFADDPAWLHAAGSYVEAWNEARA